MPYERIKVDCEAMDRLADKLSSAAEHLEAVHSRVREAEQANWGSWGKDKAGQQFAFGPDGYIKGSSDMQNVVESHGKFLGGELSTGVRDAAMAFRATEDFSAGDIGRSMGGKA
ncbi:hypothetical protein AB0H00_12950 [Nocardia sp. NPDC023852]|uniref:hypothetical protein n=1 Tax=Nocardia sp. NPDC023852 TaxID=3154697 RepID=UPI0033C8A2D7